MKVCITPGPLRDGRPWTCFRVLKDAGYEILALAEDLERSAAMVRKHLPGVDAVLAGSEPYTRAVLEDLPDLKVIARVGVGYDAVDVQAATDLGVLLTITPGKNQDSVADLTMAFVLALVRELVPMTRMVMEGGWGRSVVRSPQDSVLGILGLGRIGKTVARRALAFGFTVLASDTNPDMTFIAQHGLELVEFGELLRRSDYLTLHMPLLPETRGIINREALAMMKEGACLINTSRGALVDESALAAALRSGKLRGAGLDVFQKEPPVGSPLLSLPNVVCTPHLGGLDARSLEGMARMAAESIVEIFNGRCPEVGVVNPEAWPRRRKG
jgi:phosphoglycerate dehydrogenase-like enzyme